MNIIQTIQKKSQKEKMAIIWAIAILAAVLMIAVWVVSARFQKKVAGDTSLFQTIGNGIHNIKENYRK